MTVALVVDAVPLDQGGYRAEGEVRVVLSICTPMTVALVVDAVPLDQGGTGQRGK